MFSFTSTFDPGPLLEPLAGSLPCGADPSYDPDFQALDVQCRGKPEQQFGDTVIPAEEPDWRKVLASSLKLAERTRDLRVAVWVMRSSTRLYGPLGAATGLRLLQGLLERHWRDVHPQLDAEDGDDPTERLSALAPLTATPDGWLGDLRRQRLSQQPLTLHLSDVEQTIQHPGHSESLLTETALPQAMLDAEARSPGLLEALDDLARTATEVAQLLESWLGPARAPDLTPLLDLLNAGAKAVRLTREGSGNPGSAQNDNNPPGDAVTARPGNPQESGPALTVIHSRDDVIRELETLCQWIERHEPSHPAPLLIRRAQRLMRMDFAAIIRDMVPEGLSEVSRIAGQPLDASEPS